MTLWPHQLPTRVRGAAFGVAVAVLLYLCLAPSEDLPEARLWDKAEHAIAWFVLAAVGLALWPRRPRPVTLFALALGALVEVLQAAMPLGRDGDWRDWIADGVGVAVALLAWAAVRKLASKGATLKRKLGRKR